MKDEKCPVSFVGAGPGDPELITVKGRSRIEEADLVLYAGSLVPGAVVAWSSEGAERRDSSSMTLEETHELMRGTVRAGGLVARVHTGDPSLFGAVREQAALLERDGIPYEIIPGVTAAMAAAASAKVSFTVPERVQTLILTRLSGRTPVPEKERLEELSRRGASMAVYLSASDPDGLVEGLLAGGYDPATPVVAAYRVGWPEERIVRTRISDLARAVKEAGMQRQTVFLVLPGEDGESPVSRLYSREFSHGFRK